jgi:hypothetical protein
VTKTVPSAAGGTGVARFKDEARGLTPPSNPTRRGVFLTDVIVELGFADQDRVDAVVEAARNSPKTVEELLLEHGAVNEDQLYRAIAERNGLDHVDLEQFEVEEEAAERISGELALRHSAVPIALSEDGALIVAVADPFDSMTISDIEEAAECEVRLAIARPKAIRRLFQRLHGEEPEPEAHEVEEPEVEEPDEQPVADASLDEAQAEEPVEEREPEDDDVADPEVEEPVEDAAGPAESPLAQAPGNNGAGPTHSEDEDLRRVTRRAQRVEGELIVARRQVADLKRQLADEAPPSLELERRNAELEGANTELARANAELEKQRTEVTKKNAELRSQVSELAAWGTEVAAAAEEATRLSAGLDVLREALEKNPG